MDVDIELYRREVLISEQPRLRLGAIDPAPDRPARTMVFIHDFGGQASQWVHQLRRFSDESRCIALDLRGFGPSDEPANSAYTMEEMMGDIDRALEVLGVTEPCVLLGHSFGGAVVTEYALAHPERVSRLVLVAAAGEYSLTWLNRLALRIPNAVLNFAYTVYLKRIFSTSPQIMKRVYRNNLSRWAGWEKFRRLRVPTLVIRSNRDQVFEARFFANIAKHIEDAEDVGVSAHLMMLGRRDAVNRAIERFIQGRKTRRAGVGLEEETRERPWLAYYDSDVPYTIDIPDIPIYKFLHLAALPVEDGHPLRGQPHQLSPPPPRVFAIQNEHFSAKPGYAFVRFAQLEVTRRNMKNFARPSRSSRLRGSNSPPAPSPTRAGVRANSCFLHASLNFCDTQLQ
ncbi:MAG: alpha/beta hydrolase [Anaerolineales bacterium]|nr:alpha/beta hydrolase [Anaerolineales bacterium]